MTFIFKKSLGPFSMLMSNGVMKRSFSDICLSTSLAVRLKYISHMGYLFLGLFKISCSFQNWCKQFRKSFYFLDDCFWIRGCEVSLLRSEYLSLVSYLSAVKGVCLLDFFLTRYLAVRNFRNRLAMRLIFCFRIFKIFCRF